MSEDQFTKLFTYMTQRFDKIEAELAKKADRKDVDHIYSVLDSLLKKDEAYQQERLAILRQLERHERWHHQTAKHIDIQLNY